MLIALTMMDGDESDEDEEEANEEQEESEVEDLLAIQHQRVFQPPLVLCQHAAS